MNLETILEALRFFEDRKNKGHLSADTLYKLEIFSDCSGYLTAGGKDIAGFMNEQELQEVLRGDF